MIKKKKGITIGLSIVFALIIIAFAGFAVYNSKFFWKWDSNYFLNSVLPPEKFISVHLQSSGTLDDPININDGSRQLFWFNPTEYPWDSADEKTAKAEIEKELQKISEEYMRKYDISVNTGYPFELGYELIKNSSSKLSYYLTGRTDGAKLLVDVVKEKGKYTVTTEEIIGKNIKKADNANETELIYCATPLPGRGIETECGVKKTSNRAKIDEILKFVEDVEKQKIGFVSENVWSSYIELTDKGEVTKIWCSGDMLFIDYECYKVDPKTEIELLKFYKGL